VTRTGDPTVRTMLSRGLAAVLLGQVHLAFRRPPAAGRPWFASAAIASAAPALLVARTLRRSDSRWSPPRSGSGRALLVGYVLTGVLVEELVWRAPLLHLRPGRGQFCGALVSATAFSALHLRRDGLRTAPIHVPNTVGWTLATLLAGRLRWALLAHTGYNVAALSLRAAGTDPAAGSVRPAAGHAGGPR
jgi:membrane protease YdiL (CAAX protease family)